MVEDFEPCRAVVASLLRQIPDLHVVCEASDGLEAIAKAQELRPDVVLMDIGLPKLNGLEAARRIRELVPESKVVFFTQETDAEVVEEALSLGASAYLVKQQAGSELLAGLAAVLRGQAFVSSGLVVSPNQQAVF